MWAPRETSERRESGAPLRKGLGWVPAWIVGFAAGASGTVAVALLLYSGEGLLRSLTLIVAIELGAFGLGLITGAPPQERDEAVESLRRRWLFALVTFLAAAVFSIAWTLSAGFGALPFTQALGLALLGGLPLYSCGRLLKAIDAVRVIAGRKADGAIVLLGAAAGVLLTGLEALSGVGVPSFVLFLLVIISGTALLQGWVLDPVEEGAHGVNRDIRVLEDRAQVVEDGDGPVDEGAGTVEETEDDHSEAYDVTGPGTLEMP